MSITPVRYAERITDVKVKDAFLALMAVTLVGDDVASIAKTYRSPTTIQFGRT